MDPVTALIGIATLLLLALIAVIINQVKILRKSSFHAHGDTVSTLNSSRLGSSKEPVDLKTKIVETAVVGYYTRVLMPTDPELVDKFYPQLPLLRDASMSVFEQLSEEQMHEIGVDHDRMWSITENALKFETMAVGIELFRVVWTNIFNTSPYTFILMENNITLEYLESTDWDLYEATQAYNEALVPENGDSLLGRRNRVFSELTKSNMPEEEALCVSRRLMSDGQLSDDAISRLASLFLERSPFVMSSAPYKLQLAFQEMIERMIRGLYSSPQEIIRGTRDTLRRVK